MTISTLGYQSSVQAQALQVVRAMEANSEKSAVDATSSTIATTAAGLKISGRTASSLSELQKKPEVELGYTYDNAKAFTGMIDAAKQYLTDLEKLDAKDPKTLTPEELIKTELYPPAVITSLRDKLDGVVAAYNSHQFTFKTFIITATGDVSITAKVLDRGADGSEKSLLDFSFTQSRTDDKKNYAAVWSVDGQALMKVWPGRVL